MIKILYLFVNNFNWNNFSVHCQKSQDNFFIIFKLYFFLYNYYSNALICFSLYEWVLAVFLYPCVYFGVKCRAQCFGSVKSMGRSSLYKPIQGFFGKNILFFFNSFYHYLLFLIFFIKNYFSFYILTPVSLLPLSHFPFPSRSYSSER